MEHNMPKKKLAAARTVQDEARWFEANQEQLLRMFEKAESEGSLRIGGKSVGITLSKRRGSIQKPRSQKVMLRIPADDLDRARQQAAHRGIGYQTYIKSLLHQALERQAKAR
jgi:predicted DNA binding CopG/RHH family protein